MYVNEIFWFLFLEFLVEIWNKDCRKIKLKWNEKKKKINENNHNSVLWEKRSTVWEVLELRDDVPECLLVELFVVVSKDDDVLVASVSNDTRWAAIASTNADVNRRTGACNETGKSMWS